MLFKDTCRFLNCICLYTIVGNLLVFNGTGCSKAIPFVYFVCISYIGVAYLSLVLPVVVRFSLVIFPPFGGDINLNADIPDPHQTVAGNTALSVNVTDQQADFWKRWLEERHCIEHIFDRLKDIPNFESGVGKDGNTTCMGSNTDVDVEAGEAQVQAQAQGRGNDPYIEVASAGLWDNCPICLVDFDCKIEDATSSAAAAPESSAVDDDGNVVRPGSDPQQGEEQQLQDQLVVNFPCRGKHLFHVKVRKIKSDQIRSMTFYKRGLILGFIFGVCRQFPSYMNRLPLFPFLNPT